MENTSEFNGKFLGPIDLLKKAWKIFTFHFWTLLKILLISGIFYFLIGITFSISLSSVIHAGHYLYLVALIPVFLMICCFAPWQSLAVIYTLSAQNKVGFKDAFSTTWSKIRSYLWVLILHGAITWGLVSLFVIPGLIFALWTIFAVYVLVNEDLRGMDVLQKSREYVRGYGWRILGRLLALIPVAIICSFIPFVAILLAPLYTAYTFVIYKNLRELKGQTTFVPSLGTKRWWTVFGILGVLIGPITIAAVIVLIAINPFKQYSQARDTQRRADKEQIQRQLELYFIDNHHYPKSLSDLVPEYFSVIPTDPLTKAKYSYTPSNNYASYDFCVKLESKIWDCVLSPAVTTPTIFPENTQITNSGGFRFQVKQISQGKPDYPNSHTYELWKYDSLNQGTRIYTITNWFGFNYQVSPDGKYIAILILGESMGDEAFTLIDNAGKVLQEYGTFNAPYHRVAVGWSGVNYWIGIGDSPRAEFIEVNADSLGVTTFDISQLSLMGDDYELNLDTGKLAFSTYPDFKSASPGENTNTTYSSKTTYILSVYDLNTKTIRKITEDNHWFDPKWLNQHTLEYNNPNGTGRITKTF